MSKLSLLIGLALAVPMTANALTVTKVSSYQQCTDGESCAEISAYDADSNKIFFTNAEENQLGILDVANDGVLSDAGSVNLAAYGGGPNSVAVSGGIVAVAVEAINKTEPGTVELFDTAGNHLRSIPAGALPDMLTFTPDGEYLLVANEGEPNDEYTVDPEGSVTVIKTAASIWDWTPVTADFNAFDNVKLKDVRIFGPGASISQDLEPEYITISPDSKTAWVSLQENNALAKVDIESASITDVYGLGYKVHMQRKNAFDASNRDGEIHIQPWPTFGMYMPDAIASYQRGNATFILTANEGDARDYDGFSEEERVKDLDLDEEVFPYGESLQENENLGRLKTTSANGDIDGDGDFDMIFSYGARSFSIWNANGKQVYDSGSEFEQIQAASLANMSLEEQLSLFNSDEPGNLDPDEAENRSDDKGPEPESIVVGELGGEAYAFIGTERTSDIFIYKISNPQKPQFINRIDLDQMPPIGTENPDLGPEGLIYIERDANTGWLLVTNEISNTISLYEITE